MDTILQVITENRGLIFAHVAVALLILTVYTAAADRLSFSKGRVLLFGAIYSLNIKSRVAWALSISRLIFVCYLAICPERTDLTFGAVLLLLTAGIFVFSGDSRGFLNQLLIYTAIFGALILEGLFDGYYRDVEGELILKLISIFLGSFAALYSLYQTLIGHERLVMISGGATKEQLQKKAQESGGQFRIVRSFIQNRQKEKKKQSKSAV